MLRQIDSGTFLGINIFKQFAGKNGHCDSRAKRTGFSGRTIFECATVGCWWHGFLPLLL
jgi:hypothetical protein